MSETDKSVGVFSVPVHTYIPPILYFFFNLAQLFLTVYKQQESICDGAQARQQYYFGQPSPPQAPTRPLKSQVGRQWHRYHPLA